MKAAPHRGRASDERGLVGKLMVVWLLLFALLVVAAWDAGSIAITNFKLSNAADAASLDAATAYRDSSSSRDAEAAAQARVEQDVAGARITRFSIDPSTKEVTLTLVERASTLLAGRIGFLKHFTKVSASSTSGPPLL